MRNIYPGAQEINGLYRFSENLNESRSNYYEQEEEKMFKEKYEVKRLIESLEENSGVPDENKS